MPTTHELIKARLSKARNELREALEHVDQSLMGWAPAAGMRTVGGQMVEIAVVELEILIASRNNRPLTNDDVRKLLNLETLSDEELTARLEEPGDFETLKRLLESVRAETLAYLESLSSEQLDEEVPIHTWHMTIGLPSMPRAEVLRNIAQHESYHTGQLVSYIWARGDNPYEW